MDYSLYKLSVPPEWRDVMIAELAYLGFDMMEETEEGVEAVVPTSQKNEINVEDLIARYRHITGLTGEWREVDNINWNEEWEKNYDPVLVDDQLYIRAGFHEKKPGVAHEIIINPRMSFGTGHHATTWLMAAEMLPRDFEGKRVLDAGCGTGVLGILAAQKGASEVIAYDISELCVENTLENAEINGVDLFTECCTVHDLQAKGPFDFILANINKNALLDEISAYQQLLAPSGILFLSGFFATDLPDMIAEALRVGLKEESCRERNGWAVLGLVMGN